MRCLPLLALLVSMAAPADEVDIDVVALFKDAALLEINGERRLLKPGDTSPEGVLLVTADSREAIISLGSRRISLNLSSRIGTQFQKAERASVSIGLNEQGQYRTVGSINGRPIALLVDTGANIVAMNAGHAASLGVAFRDGQPMRAVTAGGPVAGWSVVLDSVHVGDIRIGKVRAAVLEGNYPVDVLLGMTFLRQVQMTESAGVLVLTTRF